MADIRYDGKVALVTGAGRGIGRAHAHLLASRGAKVIVNDLNTTVDGQPGDPSQNPAEVLAQELRDLGAEAISNTDSVATDDGARSMVGAALSTFGSIDIIVNNAAVAICDHIHQEPGPLYDVNMTTLLNGPMQIVRAAWDHMVEQRYGRILNTSSASIFGFYWPEDGNYMGAYVLAKSAIFGYTKQIGLYGQQFGITANAILPTGFSRTNADENGKMAGSEQGDFIQQYLTAELVANGAGFLLHEDCPVSGENFSCAGGRLARVVYAEPLGFQSNLTTPELIRDNWATVMGSSGSDHNLENFFEVRDLYHESELMTAAGVGTGVPPGRP